MVKRIVSLTAKSDVVFVAVVARGWDISKEVEYFILVLITVLADTLFRYKFEIAYVYFGNKDNTNKEIEYIHSLLLIINKK